MLETSSTVNLQTEVMTLIDTRVNPESIELVYKITPNFTYTPTFEMTPNVRVCKIIYSCVDGKWNVSAPIYGEWLPERKESYLF